MLWEEDESASLQRRRGGLKKTGQGDMWSMTDLLTVTFHETVQCVLIPSREDLRNQGLSADLWYTDVEVRAECEEAEKELLMTIPTNVPTLSLYAAMNLLYRPCSQKGKIFHFNVLIVDDSVVSRKMITLHLTQQHKKSGLTESLYIHHADSYSSALQIIKKKSFNVMIIDHVLGTESDPWGPTKAARATHRDSATTPKSVLKSSSSSTNRSGARRDFLYAENAQDDRSSASSALTGDDMSSQSSNLGRSDGSNDSRSPSRSRCGDSPNTYTQTSRAERSVEHRKVSSASGDGPWRDVASTVTSNSDSSTGRMKNSASSGHDEGSATRDSNQQRRQVKVASLSSQSSCSSDTGFTEIVSAVDNSSHRGYQDSDRTDSKSTNLDSAHETSSYTTKEDNSSSSVNSCVRTSEDGGFSTKSSSSSLHILEPQPHRYHRSKDKRMIEWGTPIEEQLNSRWSKTKSESSDSSGDRRIHAQGISRNVDSVNGEAPEKRELTVPHISSASSSSLEGGCQTSASVGDLRAPSPPPRSPIRGASRGTCSDLTTLMQQQQEGQNEDQDSIFIDAAKIGASMVRAGRTNVLKQSSDDVILLKSSPSISESTSDGYRPDSGQISPYDEAGEASSEAAGKATPLVSSSWQKTPLGDAFEGRPTPMKEPSNTLPAMTVSNLTQQRQLGNSFPTVDDSVADLLVNLRINDPVVVAEGMGLGGKTRNSVNGLKDKADKAHDDQFVRGINVDGISGPGINPHEVVVGVEGKLSTLRSWEREPSDSNLSKMSSSSRASGSSSTSNVPLRMSDLYKQKSPSGSATDLSINSLHSHGTTRSVFEAYNEEKISMSDIDPSLWNGRDIIEVIREDTPCLIIGISSHIIDDNDEAYSEGSHTVPAIRLSNELRADFVRAGADLVWAKPIPVNAWEQILDIMPLEF